MKFQKGVSGNPKGRPPRGAALADYLRAELERNAGDGKREPNATAIARTLVRLAKDGDVPAARLILSYVDGLPVQALQHSGADGTPLIFSLKLGERDDDGE